MNEHRMRKDLKQKLDGLHHADSLDEGHMFGEKEVSDTKAAHDGNKELDELRSKISALEDQYKRLLADYQNMTKRLAKEREDTHKYAAVATIEAILPALDNFEFARKNLGEHSSKDELLKSIDMLRDQFFMALKATGLETINTSSGYNPELHEAITKTKDKSKDEGTIVEVVKQGYKVRDKVIRPAAVVVSTKED